MPSVVVILTALACGVAAVSLTGWMTSRSETPSRWLSSGLHVLIATVGGAGAAAIAGGWAELVGFALLALACALLVSIDLADYRLPDAITLPMYPVLFGALTVAAAVGGEWAALGRSIGAAAVMAGGYFILALIYPAGMGLGDVKLAGLLGGFLGWFGWPFVLLGAMAGFILGGLFAVILLALRRANRKTAFPFGPWMIAGAVVPVLLAWSSISA